MADWYGTTRTNYVRVTDIEAVKKEFAPFAVAIRDDKDGRICLISEEENGGGLLVRTRMMTKTKKTNSSLISTSLCLF